MDEEGGWKLFFNLIGEFKRRFKVSTVKESHISRGKLFHILDAR